MPEPTLVYLARGRIFVRRPGEDARELESPFGKQVIERQMRDRELNGWKGRSGIWAGMGMAPPSMNQWEEAGANGLTEPRATAVARGAAAGRIVYVLDLVHVGGLFEYDLEKQSERRLMHKEGFEAGDLAINRATGTYLFSVARDNHAVRLATSEQEGRYLSVVTGGDCVDQAPVWMGGDDKHVVFQSAPVGRNQHGMPIGLGPYAIRQADLGAEQVTTLLESKSTDYLYPRPTPDGGLYFVRRPYKQPGERKLSFGEMLLDVVLFPYRLLRATFHFLNFFSMMFSGRPLATSVEGPQLNKPQDKPYLMLWGQMIDTKKALAEANKNVDVGLVPKSWELVRREKDGGERVLATNVLAYDLTANGDVLYTNGAAIFLITPAGERRQLCRAELIERVIAVE